MSRPPTPEQLRTEGEALVRQAIAAADSGDEARARQLMARGTMRLEAARLLSPDSAANVGTMNRAAAAMSTSIGRTASQENERHRVFFDAMHAKGYTLRSLADELRRRRHRIHQSTLSASLADTRMVQPSVADAIEGITGVRWPGKVSTR